MSIIKWTFVQICATLHVYRQESCIAIRISVCTLHSQLIKQLYIMAKALRLSTAYITRQRSLRDILTKCYKLKRQRPRLRKAITSDTTDLYLCPYYDVTYGLQGCTFLTILYNLIGCCLHYPYSPGPCITSFQCCIGG